MAATQEPELARENSCGRHFEFPIPVPVPTLAVQRQIIRGMAAARVEIPREREAAEKLKKEIGADSKR